MNAQQLQRMEFESGFIAALDQSGGSTPRALALYGLSADSYSGDAEMFDRMHEMRSRIVTSPALRRDRILAAILFEETLERQFDGRDAADYLWRVKDVIPRYTTDPAVSSDVIGDSTSCVFDSELTQAGGRLVKVFGWYDNEWGDTARLVDLTRLVAAGS